MPATTRSVLGSVAVATLLAGGLAAGPTAAAPPTASSPLPSERLRSAPDRTDDRAADQLADQPAPATTTTAATAAKLATAAAAQPPLADPIALPASYPSQPSLRTYPHGLPDQADAAGLLGHDDLAPQLNAWMNRSNRISAQVVGQSSQGRDLYLVTVTAPETRAQTAQQTAWRQQIRTTPGAAARDTALREGYKTPIWFSANIHGNEWEGTDASMAYLRQLVDAPWSQVAPLLRSHRLYFSLTLNPDGRTLGTRNTAIGLNENRDMITAVTPEAQSFVRTAQAVQPLYAADIHGYTGALQVEPCGPPHGENYEYDLFIPHGYAIARRIEQDVVAADIPGNTYYDVSTGEVVEENTGPDTAHIIIPFRDTASGWDDFPPVFTAQYAAFNGAVTSTVELPLGRPTGNAQSPENGRVNTAVALQTITSVVDYVSENSDAMLADQIEFFRRGVAGETKTALTRENIDQVPGPDEWKPLWDIADDQDAVTLPRAYVIPVGDGQRSRSDANRLVKMLQFNDIRVRVLTEPATVGGVTHPAGSFVVDMHQPRRSLANALLDLGSDISAKVPIMYDISAWSWSYLWGATVSKVGVTTDAPLGATRTVRASDFAGSVPADPAYLTFDLAGVGDYRALNALLEKGVRVSQLPDGSAVVPPASYAVAARTARDYGVRFEPATANDVAALGDRRTRALTDLVVGYSGTADDLLALGELGFDDVVEVTPARLTADPRLIGDVDVLWVSRALGFTPEQSAGERALEAWVAQGHSVVGSGAGALTELTDLGLVSATGVPGNPAGNGIVSVTTPAASVLAPYAQSASFIYPSLAFTGLGAGTRVEQRYARGNPFLAGHWTAAGPGSGPRDAGGLASVVSGSRPGAAGTTSRGLVFGEPVFFRVHTKGGMSQGARALFWAGSSAGTATP